ncbi:HD domain-containing protein [uncultured Desulfobacter sp.]|uniref:HD domain-containing protein n=1 Tax=uncultured Desulfobacter sp. TaxID=240139 RepID=UPI002AAB7903|nr:HD domain-containing protein [uncultured Desulfobacter sp.]
MTPDDFLQIEKQFYAYTMPFVDRAEDPYPFVLKQEHTTRVCRAMEMLCASLGLDGPTTVRACAAAMVHDMGRFPQFAVFHTYSDARSKNHAALSCREIVRSNILSRLSVTDRQLILRAVALHNRPRLSSNLGRDLDLLARLLRDADKMDIFYVMKDHYLNLELSHSFITHDLHDDGKIPEKVALSLLETRQNSLRHVNTLNGMRIFQAGMVYDLNFPAAAAAILELDVIPVLLGGIPSSDLIARLEQALLAHLRSLAASGTRAFS